MSERFTAYLDESELKAIHRMAVEHGSSNNAILRMALRFALGLPIPEWAREAFQERIMA